MLEWRHAIAALKVTRDFVAHVMSNADFIVNHHEVDEKKDKTGSLAMLTEADVNDRDQVLRQQRVLVDGR